MAKKIFRFWEREFRLFPLAAMFLAIGCLAGCMFFSPTRHSVSEALAWQKVAAQLKQTNSANLSDDLKKILRPLRRSEDAEHFYQLAQTIGNFPNGLDWLVGRTFLFAGAAYTFAAQTALTSGKERSACQFCFLAAENFVKASQHLPLWERKSVLRWASQLKEIARRLEDEPFYALTHLKAIVIKAKAHAKFVPPVKMRKTHPKKLTD